MNKNKWYESKKLIIALSFVVIPFSLGAGYLVKLKAIQYNLISLNNQKLPPFDQALIKANQASILVQKAQTAQDWQKISKIWESAIALLTSITPSDQNYNQAQIKLREYENNLDYAINNYTNPPYFRNAVNNGMEAAILAQKATTQEEWEAIEQKWQLALKLMAQVPVTDANYATAQKKLVEYQINLDSAINLSSNPNIFKALNTQNSLQNHNNQNVAPEFREGVNLAMKAATLTQKANNQQQWQEVTQFWQRAIETMKRVKTNDPKYTTAQEKVKQYQANLNYALAMTDTVANSLTLIKTITGKISPKSVVYSGNGLFFAQNMMYNHTITIYDRSFNLIKTISDSVKLSNYGHKQYEGIFQGAPVEVAFSEGGKYAWVSNYAMFGKGFSRAGDDICSPASNHDHSYLYKINTNNFLIENVIKVGAVPKYVAVSPNNKYTLVSNWCSYDLSIVDTSKNQEIKKLQLGAYPRGIVVDKNSKFAYVAVMGSFDIAKVNLEDFTINWFRGVGSSPRHLVIDPASKYLYVTLNGEGKIAKIDLNTGKTINKVVTGAAPRSMTISENGEYLYVVNYNSNTVSKVRTIDLKILQTVAVNNNPIGITYDPQTKQLWVACYSGTILIFQDGEKSNNK